MNEYDDGKTGWMTIEDKVYAVLKEYDLLHGSCFDVRMFAGQIRAQLAGHGWYYYNGIWAD